LYASAFDSFSLYTVAQFVSIAVNISNFKCIFNALLSLILVAKFRVDNTFFQTTFPACLHDKSFLRGITIRNKFGANYTPM